MTEQKQQRDNQGMIMSSGSNMELLAWTAAMSVSFLVFGFLGEELGGTFAPLLIASIYVGLRWFEVRLNCVLITKKRVCIAIGFAILAAISPQAAVAAMLLCPFVFWFIHQLKRAEQVAVAKANRSKEHSEASSNPSSMV